MQRPGQQIRRRPLLHQAARIQHPDPVTHPFDDRNVVADEQDRRRELLPQRRHQIQHFGFHRRIQPRRRLVQHQQRRALRQRHRDHHPLLHPPRKLMRIRPHHPPRPRDPHLRQHRLRPRQRLPPPHARRLEHFRDLPPHRHRRIERPPRILIHHRNFLEPQPPQPRLVQRADIHPVDQHLPAADEPRPRQRPQRRERRRRLAAPALAHQPIRLARRDRERHPPQHQLLDAPRPIPDAQIPKLERGRHSSAAWMPSATRLTPTTSDAVAPAANATVHQYPPEIIP